MLAPMMRPMLSTSPAYDILSNTFIKSPAATAIVSNACALTGFVNDPHAEVARPRLNLQTLFGSVSPSTRSILDPLADLSPTSRNTLYNSHICEPETILQVINSAGSRENGGAKSSSSSSSSSNSSNTKDSDQQIDSGTSRPRTFVLALHPGTPYPHSAIARLQDKSFHSILKGSESNMATKRSMPPAFPPAKQCTKHVEFSDQVTVIDEALEQRQYGDLLTPGGYGAGAASPSPFPVMLSPRYPTNGESEGLDRSLHPLRQASRQKMLDSIHHFIARQPTPKSKFSSTTTEASTVIVGITSPTPTTPTPNAKKARIDKHAALFDSYTNDLDSENWFPDGFFEDSLSPRSA